MATEIITPLQMYWLTRLDALCGLVYFLCALLGVASVVVAFISLAMMNKVREYSWEDNDAVAEIRRRGRGGICKVVPVLASATLAMSLAAVLMPTTRDMAAILIVPRIANNEKVQSVGNHLYDLAVEWMEELRPANKKNGDEK